MEVAISSSSIGLKVFGQERRKEGRKGGNGYFKPLLDPGGGFRGRKEGCQKEGKKVTKKGRKGGRKVMKKPGRKGGRKECDEGRKE